MICAQAYTVNEESFHQSAKDIFNIEIRVFSKRI